MNPEVQLDPGNKTIKAIPKKKKPEPIQQKTRDILTKRRSMQPMQGNQGKCC